MNIKDFKCNGVGPNSSANIVKPFIETAVSLYRLRNSPWETIEKLKQKYPGDDYHIGLRFLDDLKVTDRICSGLVELASNNANLQHTIEENIESFVYLLSGSEIDQIILEGMRDCASADHWYAFEKEWN
jgi:hypothetical protein